MKIPVSEAMDSSPAAARPEMPLTELIKVLSEHSVRAVPVTDERGRLLGVVSETDLFIKDQGVPFSLEKVPSLLGQVIEKREVDQLERCRQVTVGEVMTSKPITVTRHATLEDAAWKMYRSHVAILPVEEAGRLVGVLRRIDVLRVLYAEGAEAASG